LQAAEITAGGPRRSLCAAAALAPNTPTSLLPAGTRREMAAASVRASRAPCRPAGPRAPLSGRRSPPGRVSAGGRRRARSGAAMAAATGPPVLLGLCDAAIVGPCRDGGQPGWATNKLGGRAVRGGGCWPGRVLAPMGLRGPALPRR